MTLYRIVMAEGIGLGFSPGIVLNRLKCDTNDAFKR